MAKVYYPEHIERIQGRVCRKNAKGLIYMQRSDTGTLYVQHRHATSSPTPSAGQVAARERFKNAWAAVKVIMEDPAQLSACIGSFKAQKKYPTLRGFLFAQEYAKL